MLVFFVICSHVFTQSSLPTPLSSQVVGCHRLPLIPVCCGHCSAQCADSTDDRHLLQSTLHGFHHLSLPESTLHREGGEEVPPVGALEGEGPVCVCVCVCVLYMLIIPD